MVGTVDFMGHILYGALMLIEGKQMRSEHYQNGYKRGKALLGPMHHNLDREEMKDYLEGFRVGQGEALTRMVNRSRGNAIVR